jgi:hypothetical protein
VVVSGRVAMQEAVGSSPIIRFVWVKIPCKSIVFRLDGRVSGIFLPLFLAKPFKSLAHPTFCFHLEVKLVEASDERTVDLLLT